MQSRVNKECKMNKLIAITMLLPVVFGMTQAHAQEAKPIQVSTTVSVASLDDGRTVSLHSGNIVLQKRGHCLEVTVRLFNYKKVIKRNFWGKDIGDEIIRGADAGKKLIFTIPSADAILVFLGTTVSVQYRNDESQACMPRLQEGSDLARLKQYNNGNTFQRGGQLWKAFDIPIKDDKFITFLHDNQIIYIIE